MSKEIPKAYEPHEVEKKWSDLWLQKRLFHAEAASKKPAFCMVIPPPNVTGSLHMGHALNNTLQDILARTKRMMGFNVLWMPGTDHAGIATQNVVERELKKEGKSRQDLGREKFVERVWEWKKRHGDQIIHQLKRLGSSCDWDRERFTMDDGLSKAVREAFVKLYEEGLIHRDLYLINWCPRCRTALSDIEVEHQEQEGSLWFIRYPHPSRHEAGRPLPPRGEGYIVVATTRPETMLGDSAVAVHPDDDRYKHLHGKKVTLPLVNREIPIIADPRIDKEFGTGAVKVTPAHDPNDYAIGKDHHLQEINIFTDEAKINENGIHFQGQDRFECRKNIVKELEEKGFLEKVEKHRNAVGTCYRCHQIVEPSLSLQWFVKTKPLAKKALEAVQKGETKFFPENWAKTHEQWMENIKDWCISRQLWWGHRIPAWYCRESSDLSDGSDGSDKQNMSRCPAVVARETPKKCPSCGSTNLEQDPDVLDTWFSSALWPFSTLGWPDKTPELKTFYPTSVLITGFDIIFFWIARMMMMGLHFMGDVPFRDVYIHALVRDAEGKKMSKSKGNVVDPLTIMDKFGTDAFRFTLAVLSVPGRDVKLSEPVIEGYRNFMNKIWNATRFYISQPYEEKSLEIMSHYDKWILVEWGKSLEATTQAIEGYRFDEAAKHLYHFFWHTFCDWYLEFSKISPNQAIFGEVLKEAILALHPLIPFITEEIWQSLRSPKEPDSLTLASYPKCRKWNFEKETKSVERMIEVVTAIRVIRGENAIPVAALLSPIFAVSNRDERAWLEGEGDILRWLTRSEKVQFTDQPISARKMAHYPLGGLDIYIPLEGLVDLDLEKKRLEKEIEKLREDQERRRKKLSDPGFLGHAGAELVDAEKGQLQVAVEKLARLEETFRNL